MSLYDTQYDTQYDTRYIPAISQSRIGSAYLFHDIVLLPQISTIFPNMADARLSHDVARDLGPIHT